MARKPKTDGIEWFDPYRAKGRPFVWKDGVHLIKRVEADEHGIIFTLRCGVTFNFIVPSQPVIEARIKLPPPTCPDCLWKPRSRSLSR